MARSVDKVQHILFPAVDIIHLDGVALDGDSLLLLQIHRIQDLSLHIPLSKSLGDFYHPVGKSALSMIDVCDYTEIPYVFHMISQFIRRQTVPDILQTAIRKDSKILAKYKNLKSMQYIHWNTRCRHGW